MAKIHYRNMKEGPIKACTRDAIAQDGLSPKPLEILVGPQSAKPARGRRLYEIIRWLRFPHTPTQEK